MNKFIFTFVILFSLLGVKTTLAQTPDSLRTVISELTDRVSTLEHELEYFELNYNLNKLFSDINAVSNEINDCSTKLELNIIQKNFDKRLYNSNKELYDSFENRIKSIKELSNATSTYATYKLLIYPFTETEKKCITIYYKRYRS